MNKLLIGLALFLGSVMIMASPAFADSVSTNFDTYNPGTINGQDGWLSLGSIGSGCAVYDHAVSAQSLYTSFGSQSLRISNAVTSGCFGDMTFAKPLIDAVGEVDSSNGTFLPGSLQRHFEMQFDIASTQSTVQPGMAMSVSPDRGDGSRMSYLRFEDQSDGIHVFFDDITGTSDPANFHETDIATINRSPHTVKLTLDALDGPSNDVVKVWIDTVLKITGTSWENYYRYDSEASAEQYPRIIKTVIFRTGGTAVPSTHGNGFYFDNFSTSSSMPLLTSQDQCKNNGWRIFTNPTFRNQGQCVSYVQSNAGRSATGDIHMSNPSQQIVFSAFDKNNSDKGTVEYWNYDYPGPLHYSANVQCAKVDTTTKEARFMFQIPAGWPGLTGLYVVSYVKDVGTPGTNGDLYGHSASPDYNTALSWCQNGTTFGMYNITSGNLTVH